MNDIAIFTIAKLAVQSVLGVAALHPKPGLATPLENRALDGMAFQPFLEGAMGLFPCLINCASLGVETEAMKPEGVMTLLRPAGRHGEQDALQATRGKLSLKGTVFFQGLFCAAAGRLLAQRRNLTPLALALAASSFVRGAVERELWGLEGKDPAERTGGERAYILYGIEGGRGEAERGFPVTLKATERLRALGETHGHLPQRERAAHVLLQVMAENPDTSLAAQGGIGDLLRVQDAARQALAEGGMLTPPGREAVARMDQDFRRDGLSPRGSAIVLAAAGLILSLSEGLG